MLDVELTDTVELLLKLSWVGCSVCTGFASEV